MQKQTEYISQLDGLRAIAIALVIVFHWFPEGEGINIIANGPLGVTLFFVLSGFLITRILLSSRNYLQSHGFASTYKTFMIRRILRIFPLYYLTLLIIWLVKYIAFIPQVSTELYTHPFYYVLYLSNFLIERLHNWSDVLSPFWSLAVEEQFYILWPIILLSVKQQYLKSVIILIIVMGIISRGILAVYGYEEGVLMPTCLDAFGLGALWAYILFYNESPQKFLKILNILAVAGFALFVFICLDKGNSLLKTLFFRTSMSMFCLYFVANASYAGGFKTFFGKILNNAGLKYIGKISYGLYVYHMLVPALLLPFVDKLMNRFFHTTFLLNDSSVKVISLIMLIVVASLSWYLFESPFNGLKRYFQLTNRQQKIKANTRF
ncbi:acyltransferase [Dyadobacter sp. NIV53]|uniref:acyltransferase family protein n=1 Tax=Dyadobacter sp. NIV53 TaxID=2861765 RepID=UPI001C87E86E|nr:acyltransferase [Dyadobacter sp. NIV53]